MDDMFSNTVSKNVSKWLRKNMTSPVQKRQQQLQRLLVDHAYDPERGFFIPVTTVFTHGMNPPKFPHVSPDDGQADHFPHQFFSNALLIETLDAAPRDRLTNIGFLVVTHEHDPTHADDFDKIARALMRPNSDHGIAKFDKALRSSIGEYRGMTVVYSGNKSFHIHMIFCTKHLKNAPYEEDAAARHQAFARKAALMRKAYVAHWERSREIINDVLHTGTEPDFAMKNPTQWRRCAYGLRQDRSANASKFDLRLGTDTPRLQFVAFESRYLRAGKNVPDLIPGNEMLPPAEDRGRRKTAGWGRFGRIAEEAIVLPKLERLCVETFGQGKL